MAAIDALGWLAAGLTVAALAVKAMMPLRVTMVAASLTFIAYGLATGSALLTALHAAILPFNLFRLYQLRQWQSAAADARTGDFSLDWIRTIMRPVKFADRELVFRKGDPPHYLYYIKSGQVLLEEIGVTLGPDEVLGEIAFFTDAKERTLTARCVGKCEIMVIREGDFMRLQHQNPAFGLYIMRLLASRLLEGMDMHPDAYRPYTPLERKRREEAPAE
ncbi:MAG: cyclic nucleotide-binding domain-containing protein [Pseudomonadota bacterium]